MSSLLPCSPDRIDHFLSRPTEGAAATVAGIAGDVMVLGAGGKMGLHLCLMLRAALPTGQRVLAVSRFSGTGATAAFKSAGIETLSCDLMDRASVQALPLCKTVFYLAGQKFGTDSAPELTWMMNVVVPAYVAERFQASRIVAFSTGCVYEHVSVSGGGSCEGDLLAPPGDYANSCLGRERVFSYYSKKNGTAVSLFRLNYSVEPRYGVPVDLGLKILAGEAIDLSMGYVNLIWQRDAVARAIQSLDLASSPAVPINVTGPETIPVRALASQLGALLGKEPVFCGQEASTAWLSNAGQSLRLWGNPETSLDQMLEWVAAWLKAGEVTLGKPTHFESTEGKF